jgi:hypothetical protein
MIIKKVLILLFLLFTINVAWAQDTRRMYFGLSVEPTFGWLTPEYPFEASSGSRFGINVTLQSFKYLKQWFGIYFGVNLVNAGGRIRYADDFLRLQPEDTVPNDMIICRFQYIGIPFGVAFTTPLKRNFQVNCQLGLLMAFNISESAAIRNDADNTDIAKTFMPACQVTLSAQYHIGQDVYLHIGPSYIRSMSNSMNKINAVQQGLGIRAGIIF